MSDPVELSDSLYDDSIEVVGTISPGATPYKLRVKAALQTQIADHETRIDSLEGGGGSGDVVGPSSATDNAVVRFDTTTGKLVQNSAVTIADSTGNMAGVGTLNTRTIANWVDGPASASAGAVPTFSGTSGKLVADSGVLLTNLVLGPASATDNAIVRFDTTSGKLVQNSAVTVADTTGSIDNTSGSGTVTSTRFIGPATGLRTTTGPTDLTMAAVVDGEYLKRSGSTIVSGTGGASTVADAATNFAWSSNAATIDVSLGHNFTATNALAGNSTLTLSNGVDGDNGLILVKQDSTARTLTFTISGRTVLKDLNVPDTNPLSTASSITMYQYFYVTTVSTAYVVLNKVFLQ